MVIGSLMILSQIWIYFLWPTLFFRMFPARQRVPAAAPALVGVS
jgi:hypothetical protein